MNYDSSVNQYKLRQVDFQGRKLNLIEKTLFSKMSGMSNAAQLKQKTNDANCLYLRFKNHLSLGTKDTPGILYHEMQIVTNWANKAYYNQ